MQYVLGYSPKHKLLAKEDRNAHFLNERESKEERVWMQEFGESLFVYASLPQQFTV
jgi:hypothetical protein